MIYGIWQTATARMSRIRVRVQRLAGAFICLSCCAVSLEGREISRIFPQMGPGTRIAISLDIPAKRAGLSLTIDRALLSTYQLCLYEPEWMGTRRLYIDNQARIHDENGELTVIREQGELLVTPRGATLFVDDIPLPANLTGWHALWITEKKHAPSPRVRQIPLIRIRDDFMRQDIEVHPFSRITGGIVRLAQHGGGMPTTPEQEADPEFGRAVNPFSVFASEQGRLSYNVHGADTWGDVNTEARFYFGKPKTGDVVDTNTLPTGADMLVVQGPADGKQVAFGWSGEHRIFVLKTRVGNGPWQILKRWSKTRPPLTNWIKIGLQVTRGHLVEGFLDGVSVLSADLTARIRGPFHIQSGRELTEFDDVRAHSLPPEPETGTRIHVESRQFAGKRKKSKSDPEQYDEWASSAGAFVRRRWLNTETAEQRAMLVTAKPLIGDFSYSSLESASMRMPLPEGLYEFAFFRPAQDGSIPNPRNGDKPVFSFSAVRSDGEWHFLLPGEANGEPGSDASAANLRLKRTGKMGNKLQLCLKQRAVPISSALPGPLHLGIARVRQPGSKVRFLFSPSPSHHLVRSRNLIHEFFEEAPVDWNWLEGAFRMDCRWACQKEWNFMSCASTGIPCMISKRRFAGNQIHEYFVSLRSVFPWDAGDTTFTYDPTQDRENNFAILIRNHGWYNRRDLNFSFCTEGVDPLSGYSVVFGGDDNRETRLLRKGIVVASTREPDFLFPKDSSHLAVHWNWWKFTVSRLEGTILVDLNDTRLFMYTDPDPLQDGHIAFWSLRNGFALSRVTSTADRIATDPHFLYVADDALCGWRPLLRDSVQIDQCADSSMFRVKNTTGGGFFAVRYELKHPVDLIQTPVLELPLALGPGTVVCAHLQIGGKNFILGLDDAPLSGMKTLLTPEFEHGKCFRLPTLTEKQIRESYCLGECSSEGGLLRVNLLNGLRNLTALSLEEPILTSLTLGNTSNEDYLLAGNRRNMAGCYYLVGKPSFLAQGD